MFHVNNISLHISTISFAYSSINLTNSIDQRAIQDFFKETWVIVSSVFYILYYVGMRRKVSKWFCMMYHLAPQTPSPRPAPVWKDT